MTLSAGTFAGLEKWQGASSQVHVGLAFTSEPNSNDLLYVDCAGKAFTCTECKQRAAQG